VTAQHIVTVVNRPEDDGTECTIECTDPASCSGWEECLESEHGDDADDEEEREIHGVTHRWVWSHGWVLPLPADRCPVTEHDLDYDAFQDLPSGRYLVETDWDDTDLYLDLAHGAQPHRIVVAMAALHCEVRTNPLRDYGLWCFTHDCHVMRSHWSRPEWGNTDVCKTALGAIEAILNVVPAPKEQP